MLAENSAVNTMTRPSTPCTPSHGLILVIEDDPHIANLVKTYLQHEGFDTAVAHDGERGLQLARQHQPRLVVLDLMLPGMDGWEVSRQLRQDSDLPILMLTARGEEVDRILGFALGADDYVVKPFSPRELVERVKAILRRAEQTLRRPQNMLRHGGLSVDLDGHQVRLDGQTLALTPTEFRLLEALMHHPGQVFSRTTLLERINTQGEVVVDRVIDVHVGKLRRKLENSSGGTRYIETVRGIGYRLNPEVGSLPG